MGCRKDNYKKPKGRCRLEEYVKLLFITVTFLELFDLNVYTIVKDSHEVPLSLHRKCRTQMAEKITESPGYEAKGTVPA
ncbi:hypothetical protein [Metallosphaera sp.]|uniref:hypothetical protein n=1 Tax=Metallosphaera sp. TaxID=2020860 RepID=UPI003163BF04